MCASTIDGRTSSQYYYITDITHEKTHKRIFDDLFIFQSLLNILVGKICYSLIKLFSYDN